MISFTNLLIMKVFGLMTVIVCMVGLVSASWENGGCDNELESKVGCIPCHQTCADLDKDCPLFGCALRDECYCKNGYVRRSDGTCIPMSECFSQAE